jgi:catechol 2,3-dioxygenase-like lactoylglutathione lyase family enzyme
MAKPKIRHLALFARNPKKLAEFYQSVFEMEVIGKAPDDTAFFLSDGYLTLAILPHREGGEIPLGINHFGFQIADTAAIGDKLTAFGVAGPAKRPADRPYAESRAFDPEGNRFDLSEHGYENDARAR